LTYFDVAKYQKYLPNFFKRKKCSYIDTDNVNFEIAIITPHASTSFFVVYVKVGIQGGHIIIAFIITIYTYIVLVFVMQRVIGCCTQTIKRSRYASSD
jgi:hypothetical protein